MPLPCHLAPCRELEMPSAALHHAGIQAVKLEDLERRLRADLAAEAAAWGGKVLLHREVPTSAAAGGGSGGGSSLGTVLRLQMPGPTEAHVAAAAAAAAEVTAAATVGEAAGSQQQQEQGGQALTQAAGSGAEGGGAGADRGEARGVDDITRTTDYQATTEVQAFWESTGVSGDVDLVSGGGTAFWGHSILGEHQGLVGGCGGPGEGGRGPCERAGREGGVEARPGGSW